MTILLLPGRCSLISCNWPVSLHIDLILNFTSFDRFIASGRWLLDLVESDQSEQTLPHQCRGRRLLYRAAIVRFDGRTCETLHKTPDLSTQPGETLPTQIIRASRPAARLGGGDYRVESVNCYR